jgi:hypothetical protein
MGKIILEFYSVYELRETLTQIMAGYGLNINDL